MNQYYLMAQLPSLDSVDEKTPLPIGEAEFFGLCSRFLNKKALTVLKNLSLVPERNAKITGSRLVDAWNSGERCLRLALLEVRSKKMGKPSDTENSVRTEFLQTAKTAAEMDDPLLAERFLNRFRLNFLETLRPMDGFCEDALFYYCLKLKLISRMKQFDEEKGRAAYKKIYNSIMASERTGGAK